MRASVLLAAAVLGIFSSDAEARVRVKGARAPTKATTAVANPADALATTLASDAAAEALSEPESWRWLDGSGHPVPSFQGVLEEISKTSATRENVEIHVGCDSAVQHGSRVCFATVICIVSSSCGGGRYFYSRTVEPQRNYPVLQTRLLREVECSLNTAEALTAHGVAVETVHCDSNTDPACKSTEHTRMLVGYIQSMGYDYLVKPQAWATFVADRHSRGLLRLRPSAAAAFQA